MATFVDILLDFSIISYYNLDYIGFMEFMEHTCCLASDLRNFVEVEQLELVGTHCNLW